uniref:Cornifelin homolog B-like n=1 Tax=Maylandia zebra TaxID=106582 RepID=A0A3P9C1L7_9CICH
QVITCVKGLKRAAESKHHLCLHNIELRAFLSSNTKGLFAYFCLPCFACKTSRDYGENLCLPLADWVSGMIPPATMSMRVSMRHRYGITGTMCNDCVLSTFCMSCVWCQMSREMKKRALPVVMVATKNV